MRLWSRFAAGLALTLCLGCAPDAQRPDTAPLDEVTEFVGEGITLDNPDPGARVTSPLRVTGTASGTWFFEAVFPAELRSADGALIAEAPAQAQGDWMTTDQVPFVAEFRFEVRADAPAFLVLREDMQEDGEPREVQIPVVLAAAP